MKIDRRHFIAAMTAFIASCKGKPSASDSSIYDVYDPKMLDLILPQQELEVLGSGYTWSEGPAWDKARQTLYFTDVPENIAYSWTQEKGVEIFLSPSSGGAASESGANGLLYNKSGRLLICNHGQRSVEEYNLKTKERKTITKKYKGQSYNSPNDIIESRSGDVFFTDPPYGLEGLNASPLKELAHNGVYRVTRGKAAELLIDDLDFPNGIVLSPDETTLYVAQSSPEAQNIYTLDLTAPNQPRKLFADLNSYAGPDAPGLPDGMVVDQHGNLFATGPGGVFVINPEGKILGRIKTGKASANCTFGEDGSTLFITNHDRLVKLKTQTKGLSWT